MSLPQTCFCPVCLAGFEKDMGVRLPAELATTPDKADWILARHAAEWTEWKCRTIARAVERLAAAARAVKPGVRINLHAVPWREADFGGAAASVAGQDLARLAPLVDLISPMAYHHMVGRDPAWVHSVVADVARRTKTPVLASIQVSKPMSKPRFRRGVPGRPGRSVEAALDRRHPLVLGRPVEVPREKRHPQVRGGIEKQAPIR